MNFKYVIMLAAAMVVAMSCGKNDGARAKRLFVIGIDGASSKSFVKAEIPNMQQLMDEGSYSLAKRSVLPSSSAINWCTMFMAATPETHGYTEWGSRTPEIPSWILGDNNIFPTIFQLYRKANPEAKMGCIYDWEGIKYIVDTASFNYHEKTPEGMDPDNLKNMAIDYIRTKPDVGAFIFDNPDHMGHTYGWDSVGYIQMISTLDKCIGEIVSAIKEEGMYEESMIVIISDHGGINRGHGGKTMDELEAPAIFEGPGIKKGFCIDNQWCLHQFDVGATIAKEFGLQFPQACTGQAAEVIFE